MKKTKEKQILSIGNNKKLGEEIGILNLPRLVTCPGATALCKVGACCSFTNAQGVSKTIKDAGKCYAAGAPYDWPSCAGKRKWNHEQSLQADFVDRVVKEIQTNELSRVRFHESGDVYSADYLLKLVEIAKRCPTVEFLMYTKSWDRFGEEWAQMPSNVSIYLSKDRTTDTTKVVVDALKSKPTAWLRLPDEPVPQGATCVHPNATKAAEEKAEIQRAAGKK